MILAAHWGSEAAELGAAVASLPHCYRGIALADDFQTTLTSTAIRFAHVSKRRVVVVYYQNNVVRWSYSDPKKKLPFVLAGRRVPDYSSATLDSNEVATEMDHYEETKRMSNLKGGLTLLWFP